MKSLILTDNNKNGKIVDKDSVEVLRKISDKTINELIELYPNLLIFPTSLNTYNENIENDKIFSIKFDKVFTHNIVGFIGINNISISIGSRFDDSSQNEYFLQYMLSKVFAINIVDFKNSAKNENIWDFLLIYLFSSYLNKAFRQGLFKEYREQNYNNSNIKGKVDVARHLKSNIPFAGNIAYKTREFSYDNKINQLIRHTIEFISNRKYHNSLNNNPDTVRNVKVIREITPTYNPRDSYSVITDNYKKINHPYFTEYENLRKICLRILRREGLSYKDSKEKVYGILFDSAWLWEEYVNTILRPLNFIHPRNKTKSNKIYLFDNNTYSRYPDFYKKDNSVIIDAKYKHLNIKEIDRNDIHQIISYLHVLKSDEGYLLYPINEKTKTNEIDKIGELNGYKGVLYRYGFKIPQKCNTYKEFSELIENSENRLIEIFKNQQEAQHST